MGSIRKWDSAETLPFTLDEAQSVPSLTKERTKELSEIVGGVESVIFSFSQSRKRENIAPRKRSKIVIEVAG